MFRRKKLLFIQRPKSNLFVKFGQQIRNIMNIETIGISYYCGFRKRGNGRIMIRITKEIYIIKSFFYYYPIRIS